MYMPSTPAAELAPIESQLYGPLRMRVNRSTYDSSTTTLFDHLLCSILVAQVHTPQVYSDLIIEVFHSSLHTTLLSSCQKHNTANLQSRKLARLEIPAFAMNYEKVSE